MVNVGLRAYLWEKKDRSQRVTRELWSVNGLTYHALRQYTTYVKEHGFPDQSVEGALKTATPLGQSPSLQTRESLARQTSLAWKASRSFSFAGIQNCTHKRKDAVFKLPSACQDLLQHCVLD